MADANEVEFSRKEDENDGPWARELPDPNAPKLTYLTVEVSLTDPDEERTFKPLFFPQGAQPAEMKENPPKRVKTSTDTENVRGILVEMDGKITSLYEEEMNNLTKHLQCVYYEVIGLHFHEDLNIMAYIDEEGKYNAKVNRRATAFARKSLFTNDKLHGNVIFVNAETDDEGKSLPLTPEQVLALTELKPTKATHDQTANFGFY